MPPYPFAMVATESAVARGGARTRGRVRPLLGVAVGVVVIVVAAVVVVLLWSGVTLAGDSTALAHVSVQPFGGHVEQVHAYGPRGRAIPIAVNGGRLTPLVRLKPGEAVSVDVQVRRPGWLAWALGKTRTEHLTLRTPAAHVSAHWMTVRPGSDVRVGFDQPVSAVAFGGTPTSRLQELPARRSSISLGRQASTGPCRSPPRRGHGSPLGRPRRSAGSRRRTAP